MVRAATLFLFFGQNGLLTIVVFKIGTVVAIGWYENGTGADWIQFLVLCAK